MSNAPFRGLAFWSAVVVVGLAALVMGTTLFSGVMVLAIVAGSALALLSMAVCWFSLRWTTETAATRFCLLGSVAAGVVGVLAASVFSRWYLGSNALLDAALPSAMSTTLSSAVLGAPPGLVFGALFALPIRRVHRLCRDRAIEATDRAVRVCACWLLVIGLACIGLDLLAFPALDSPPWATRSLLGGTALVVGLASLAALGAHVRIGRRRRWFERVQAGGEPGWTIAPRSAFAQELDDLAPLFVSGTTHNVVLVRHEAVEGGGAYRTASNLVPHALVHLPEGLAAMSFALPSDEERLGPA